jgi:hypothetical protein
MRAWTPESENVPALSMFAHWLRGERAGTEADQPGGLGLKVTAALSSTSGTKAARLSWTLRGAITIATRFGLAGLTGWRLLRVTVAPGSRTDGRRAAFQLSALPS